MVLEIVKYGHPVLRQKGARVEKITPEIKKFIADMLETMHAKNGVGLAAQQVGRALQITVIDVPEIEDRPAWMEIGGKRVELKDNMPLVLIDPEITPVGEVVAGGEGCLSFPEIFAQIKRADSVDVRATDEKGKTIEFRGGGLLARAVLHEVDHLNGILFIDRMDKKTKAELQAELDAMQATTKTELERKK